jgi:hypothetical protein
MKIKLIVLIALAILGGGIVFAQRTAREAEQHSIPTPEWKNDPEFEKDVFTFVRLKYMVNGRHGWGHTRPGERWAIDFPDGDLNMSYRLQQMTSMKVDPNGLALGILEKELTEYPFVYVVEPGRLTFEDEEIVVLRKYLLNGGFMLVDDFWGDREWLNFEEELKLLFPDREWIDLPDDHPIFNGVFPLTEKPQVPGIDWGRRGMTYEPNHGLGSQDVHYRAILDDKKRIMILMCHNTDLGDGWEREGENQEYFHRFSEKVAYPIGINIIFYAMTH